VEVSDSSLSLSAFSRGPPSLAEPPLFSIPF
jgi:hypothetical protein